LGTTVSEPGPTKTAEAMDVPFGIQTWMGPRNHLLGGGGKSPGRTTVLGKHLPGALGSI